MVASGYGRQRQRDIYLAGLRGRKPRVPQNAAALERAAQRAMSREGFAYIAGGATLEMPLLGWRLRDLDLAYLPFALGKGIAQYVADPEFQRQVDAAPVPARGRVTLAALRSLWRVSRAYPGSTWQNLRSPRPRQAA